MKIKTKEDLQDCLASDLSWRKKELTNLYNDVRTAKQKKLPTALRCAVVLLYAHWEGFIKNATETYLSYIKFRKLRLDEVNNNILALSLKQKIKEFSESNKATYHVEFVNYFRNNMTEQAKFSENDSIKTKSNLNSVILAEIFATVGLDITTYSLKANMIDSQLLNYRNTIAHGNYLLLDILEYNLLHAEVITMLDNINGDIINACILEEFMA
jgi:hypothetical protein